MVPILKPGVLNREPLPLGVSSDRCRELWRVVKSCPQMDQEWTKSIESPVLNRPRMAEGAGFEPADRVNDRRFSRPVLSAAQPPLR